MTGTPEKNARGPLKQTNCHPLALLRSPKSSREKRKREEAHHTACRLPHGFIVFA